MATTKRDYYEILGLSKNAGDADIKKSYRNLARKHHPDVDKSSGAHEKFKEINEAYQVLSDSKKKQAYDQFGHAAFDQSTGFGGGAGQGAGGYRTYTWGQGQNGSGFDFGGFSDPFDIFEMFFGGSSPFGRRARMPRYVLTLKFSEAVCGVEKEVELNGKRTKIKIPAGVDDGTEIQFSDYVIVTEVQPDPRFKRQGYDIFSDHELSFSQAALGATIEAETVDGPVKVRVQPGAQPGTQLRLHGKGVPHIRTKARGDHYIRLLVKVPTKLNRHQKDLLEELGESF